MTDSDEGCDVTMDEIYAQLDDIVADLARLRETNFENYINFLRHNDVLNMLSIQSNTTQSEVNDCPKQEIGCFDAIKNCLQFLESPK